MKLIEIKQKINALKQLLYLIVLSPFIKRDNNLWLFGNRGGWYYTDNSKYLFEYIADNKTEKSIWITRRKNIYNYLKVKGYNVEIAYSLKGCLAILKAGVGIVSVSRADISTKGVADIKFIQLWHGTPIKSIDIGLLNENYDMVTVAAKGYLDNTDLMSTSKDYNYTLTGFPRNDIFSHPPNIQLLESLKKEYEFEKIIFYLPTYRSYNNDNEFDLLKDYNFSLKKIEGILKAEKALLLFKPHPVDFSSYDYSDFFKSKNIHIIAPDSVFTDVYDYLPLTDIMISDYSGILLDFLITEKPVIFAPFDIDKYKKEVSFCIRYDDICCGPVCNNWDEVCEAIYELLSRKDRWANERAKVNQRFNFYQDGNSSERVYNAICGLTKGNQPSEK
jgi:CDP-glycerol glycerophosphotransferase (TagB/SpsB family)